MAWIRAMGGGDNYEPLMFPPNTGWSTSGTATDITINGDTNMYAGNMTSAQEANFTHNMKCGKNSHTITVDCYSMNQREYHVYVDGLSVADQTVPAQSVVLINATVPAGNHVVTIKITNYGNANNAGNSYIRSVGTT